VTGVLKTEQKENIFLGKKYSTIQYSIAATHVVGRGVFQTLLVLCGDFFAGEILYIIFGTVIR
jgi:hypothetical protein